MENDITVEKKFTYNAKTEKYVFHSEQKLGKNIVLGTKKVNTIIELYSNYDKNPATMGDISKKMGIPKAVIEFIIRALNITHDTLPFTAERLESTNEDELVEEMVGNKAFNVNQKFEKLDWKLTQDDAQKWRLFKQSKLNPIESFIENWTPPKYVPVHSITKRHSTGKELIIGASDWHYGLFAHERYLYNQKEWNIDETEKAVKEYGLKLKSYIAANQFSKVNICFMGDLSHTLNGETDKGTQLEAHPIAEEQLDRAFNSMVEFLNNIISAHSHIQVYACSGNHSALGDYVLVKMLSLYFKDDHRIKFTVTNKRFVTFKIFSTNLFIMEHGYSSVSRDRLPAPGKGRETYVNNIILSKPEDLAGTERTYYLSADQHHMESYEMNAFEGYMFPTLVGGCRHADNSGYKSRPRQTCLTVGNRGVDEVKYFYFD